MAIKRGLNKKLAEIGKIKTGYKGEMVQSKNGAKFQPPKKLDYFIITTTERDPKTGNLIQDGTLMDKIGDKPRELKIRLPFDSIDKNFFTQFQAYNGGKKICAGDGETGAVTVKDDKLMIAGEERTTVPCDPETCPILAAGKCKVSGILSVFLPQAGDLGGVYKYRTHSWNGVSSILAALEFFAENTGGILQGMPLKLVLVKKTTEEHGNINYATIVIDGEEIHGLRRLAIEEKRSRSDLGYDIKRTEAEAEKAGFFKDGDPEAEVEAEFYAENGDEPRNVTPPKGTSSADLAGDLAGKHVADPAPEGPNVSDGSEGTGPTIGKKPAAGKDDLDIF
jgi:hypothetical protein